MSNQPVISVEDLGKCYRISHQAQSPRYVALRDVLAENAKRLFHPRHRRPASARSKEDFWALKSVTFELKQGEVVGIIGRNGAGKSTLLKVLSRITEPSEGRVRIKGRVASLLEVGTGFHPELTGRENIFLNGAILGMCRAEIRKRFDEIVTFAQVERFLDTAVKHYSSGMYVRLAFAVAAHLQSEILIVDEVLAVGDSEFQKKCLGKMDDVAKRQGRTVIFVSHNMGSVRTLCSRAILLRNGEIAEAGPTGRVIKSYLATAESPAESTWERSSRSLPKPAVYFRTIEAAVHGKQPNLLLNVRATLVCQEEVFPKTFTSIDLCDAFGTPLLQAIPVGEPFLKLRKGKYALSINANLPPLIPGRYALDLWVGTHYTSTIDYVKNVVSVTVEESPVPNRTFPHSVDHGSLVASSKCEYHRIQTEGEPERSTETNAPLDPSPRSATPSCDDASFDGAPGDIVRARAERSG